MCLSLSPLPLPLSGRVRDEDCRLMVWDTAGQEEFDAITKAYYRGKGILASSPLLLLMTFDPLGRKRSA